MPQPKQERCPGCRGKGTWQTACCNGAGGCSCEGDIVDMGTCNVCGGAGTVTPGEYDARANLKAIQGLHFVGTGGRDTHSLWPNRGGYGR